MNSLNRNGGLWLLLTIHAVRIHWTEKPDKNCY